MDVAEGTAAPIAASTALHDAVPHSTVVFISPL